MRNARKVAWNWKNIAPVTDGLHPCYTHNSDHIEPSCKFAGVIDERNFSEAEIRVIGEICPVLHEPTETAVYRRLHLDNHQRASIHRSTWRRGARYRPWTKYTFPECECRIGPKVTACVYRLANRNEVYGNTFVTRFRMDSVDKSKAASRAQLLRSIWNARDAASRAQLLFSVAKTLSKDRLLLLALGPTATALAHDLHIEGLRALDLGHVDVEYEWFRMGATTKVPIRNKFVNEAPGGTDVGELKDKHYRRQTLAECS